jgi:hypothetical protein
MYFMDFVDILDFMTPALFGGLRRWCSIGFQTAGRLPLTGQQRQSITSFVICIGRRTMSLIQKRLWHRPAQRGF